MEKVAGNVLLDGSVLPLPPSLPDFTSMSNIATQHNFCPQENSLRTFAENISQHAEILKNMKDYEEILKVSELVGVHYKGIDLGEWEFAAEATPAKAIGGRCRSAGINQSILNILLSRKLTDEQLPTKLAHIGELKSTIKIFNYAMEIYEKVNKMFYELDHGHNLLKDIFKVDDYNANQHSMVTPKNKSQVLTVIEEMKSKAGKH
ncbi:8328_t:CDS:2 [Entrophospora sp. SA101]|nr:8328_t:CDS:2 [Entrophospora sp. SA101]